MFDFAMLPVEELREIIENAQMELEKRIKEDLQQAVADLQNAAARTGMTPAELAALASLPVADTESKVNSRKRGSAGEPKYRNPDNPDQVWSGRGKHPAWFKEAIASGISQDDLRV